MNPRRQSILLSILGVLLIGGTVQLSTSCSTRKTRLSPAERQWLEEHGRTIRIAPLPDSPPIEFFDQDGQHLGLTADYFKLIEQRLDIHFVRVECGSWKEILEKLENREVDLVGSVQDTPERRRFLHFTQPYQHIPNVILMRKESGSPAKGLRVAVVSDSATQGYLEKHHPEYRLVPVKGAASGLHMLSFGEVDAMVADLGVASYYIEKLGISNLRVAGGIDYPWNLCFASRKDWPRLNAILEKTLAGISPRQRRAIRRKWITLNDTAIVPRARYLKVLGTILLFTLLAVGSVMVWNRSLTRQVRHRTRALNKSEARFRNLVETTSDWIWEIDQNGLCTYASPQVSTLLGYTPGELLGTHFASLMPQEEAARYKALLQKGAPIHALENTKRHKNGQAVVMETSGVPFFDEDGNIQGFRGIDRDITRRKQTEEMMVQSEKMVSVGGLAAGMAHEINNPLAGILQNLQVLLNRGKLLLDIQRRLAAPAPLSEEERIRFIKFINKARLAFGDCALLAAGQYDILYAVKKGRIPTLGNCPGRDAVTRGYLKAIELKEWGDFQPLEDFDVAKEFEAVRTLFLRFLPWYRQQAGFRPRSVPAFVREGLCSLLSRLLEKQSTGQASLFYKLQRRFS